MPDCWQDRDYSEPMYISGPHDGDIRFGAQVGWSPKREGQCERDCSECGGLLVFMLADPEAPVPITFDRRRDYDPEVHGLMIPPDDAITGNRLCAGCARWAQDNRLSLLMDAERMRRGTNEPVPVFIPKGGTIPIPIPG